MNATERRLAGRLYVCLTRMADLQPSNAADIAAISRGLRVSAEAARCLSSAVIELSSGDRDHMAAEFIDDAERVLGGES